MSANKTLDKIVAFTPAGQRYEINLNEDQPDSLTSEKKREQYQRAVLINASRMKKDIESGQFIPTTLDVKFEEEFARNMKAYEVEVKQYFENLDTEDHKDDSKYKFLYAESQLIDFDACVKLKIRDNMDECLKKAKDLMKVDFRPLMFKKNPQVVQTIKKVSDIEGSLEIAGVAKSLYNKIKGIFNIPNDIDFESYFHVQVSEFKEKCKDLNSVQLHLLTSEF